MAGSSRSLQGDGLTRHAVDRSQRLLLLCVAEGCRGGRRGGGYCSLRGPAGLRQRVNRCCVRVRYYGVFA